MSGRYMHNDTVYDNNQDGDGSNDPDVDTLSTRLADYRNCAGATGPQACP